MLNPPDDPQKKKLRILLLEDSAADAQLLGHELEEAGIVFLSRRVETEVEFVHALGEFRPDLILSDYHLPAFDGLSALILVEKLAPDVPVIFVSGTVGEELAVELLRRGAVDYVLKDHRSRLPLAVERALREVEERAVRRQAEEQVRKLSRAVEQSAVSIVITDTRGIIEYVNPKFETVTGYSAAEVIGKNPGILKSGRTSPAEYARLWQTILAGGEWRGEFLNRKKNGELFWEFASISPIRDARGEITHFVASKEDITENKRLEAQFLRAQRMETLGALAGGIAHDLNNILTPIVMCAPLLRTAVQGNRGERMISTIEASARRGAAIVKQILTFGRGVQSRRQALSLPELVDEMVSLATETFPRNIRILRNVDPDLPAVVADATQLHQVLLNLCVNARDAMPGGGDLRITARRVENPPRERGQGTARGLFALLEVADTGTGIPPEILDKIFEPFFTTKAVAGEPPASAAGTGPGSPSGTGLGLSTTMAIVRSHDGFITVQSTPEVGSVFRVFLPAAPVAAVPSGTEETSRRKNGSEAMEQSATPISPAPPGAGELILFVDEEVSLQALARTVIEAEGYRTLTATDGAAGLALFHRHRPEIAAVLVDVDGTTPGSLDLVRTLRGIDPAVKIIAAVSDENAGRRRELEAHGVTATLSRPYTAETLLETLASVLRQPVPAGETIQ